MTSKAENTTKYIIETVAPILNKNGYAATSLSDITKATGLTKGAIYGNFRNKEHVAAEAFQYMVTMVVDSIKEQTFQHESPIKKLYAITEFYRNYYKFSKKIGGCPILNIGVDANNSNKDLLDKVRLVIEDVHQQFAEIIEKGQKAGEMKLDINPMSTAKKLHSMMQGAVFMSSVMDDPFYLYESMNQMEKMIEKEIKR